MKVTVDVAKDLPKLNPAQLRELRSHLSQEMRGEEFAEEEFGDLLSNWPFSQVNWPEHEEYVARRFYARVQQAFLSQLLTYVDYELNDLCPDAKLPG